MINVVLKLWRSQVFLIVDDLVCRAVDAASLRIKEFKVPKREVEGIQWIFLNIDKRISEVSAS